MEILDAGLFPDQPRCKVIWRADKTETAIALHVQGHDFVIKPNVEVVVPANVFEICVQSSYDVELLEVIEIDGELLLDADEKADDSMSVEPLVPVENPDADTAPADDGQEVQDESPLAQA